MDRCGQILDAYFAELETVPKESADAYIAKSMKRAVLALNRLTANIPLIETDQRESLCAILLGAARRAGFSSPEDITHEWRKW